MITRGTKVTFPGGSTSEVATVLLCQELAHDPTKAVVITDITPFHPVDYTWPDQPADMGVIKIDGREIKVEQCLTAAIEIDTKKLLIDREISVKKNDSAWLFLVAHIIDKENIDPKNVVGTNVTLQVNKNYRHSLNIAHSVCHLASLALNKNTMTYWTKEYKDHDSLGSNDLDRAAVLKSEVMEYSSRDRYRLGKSLRKKGFDSARFFAEIKDVEHQLNNQLREWTQSPLDISVTPSIAYLTERREWSCKLPEGIVKIFCGGTHPKKLVLDQGRIIQIELQKIPDAPEFVMLARC